MFSPTRGGGLIFLAMALGTVLVVHLGSSLTLRLLPGLGPLHEKLTRRVKRLFCRFLGLLEARQTGSLASRSDDMGDHAPFLLRLALNYPRWRRLLALVHARALSLPLPTALGPVSQAIDATPPPPAPAPRSVAFFRHSYYNFFFLAEALRRRGWDAIVVNPEPEDGPNERYFFGQDLRTHDPDPARNKDNLLHFLQRVAADYRMLHFHGVGGMWVLPEHSALESIPWELLGLKDRGVKFGFTVSGCLDMVSQESFRRWSGDLCRHCAWRENSLVCTDQRNLILGQKVLELCELVCNEAESLLDLRVTQRTYLDPLTGAMDPEFWHPELEIPQAKLRPREPGELLIYHALGNAADRLEDGADIKGSRVILKAVESLKARGHKIRLDFVTDLPSREVRFAQAQADIVVDQIRYGRWGATAREALMLGKPVVANINLDGGEGYASSRAITEAPVVHATPESIEAVLEELIRDRDRRRELGKQGRQHALEWWSADACAERYERVYDRLMQGLPPQEELPLA